MAFFDITVFIFWALTKGVGCRMHERIYSSYRVPAVKSTEGC